MTIPCDFIKCFLVWSMGPSFPFDIGDIYIDIVFFISLNLSYITGYLNY